MVLVRRQLPIPFCLKFWTVIEFRKNSNIPINPVGTNN